MHTVSEKITPGEKDITSNIKNAVIELYNDNPDY